MPYNLYLHLHWPTLLDNVCLGALLAELTVDPFRLGTKVLERHNLAAVGIHPILYAGLQLNRLLGSVQCLAITGGNRVYRVMLWLGRVRRGGPIITISSANCIQTHTHGDPKLTRLHRCRQEAVLCSSCYVELVLFL